MKIDIYITSRKDFSIQKKAKSKWLIVGYNPDGSIRDSKDGVVLVYNATAKKAALCALKTALLRFNAPAVIKIYVSDPFVRNMLRANMPYRWSCNDWKKYRYNRDIKYVDLWQKVFVLLKNHAVIFADTDEIDNNNMIKKMEVKYGE